MKEYMCPSCLYYIKGEVNKCPNCGCRIRPKLDRITKSKLKKIAWKEFSSYIRLKQCIKTTGEIDTGICYTCGRTFSIDKLQAGHLKNEELTIFYLTKIILGFNVLAAML